jgi:hypothetical protein
LITKRQKTDASGISLIKSSLSVKNDETTSGIPEKSRTEIYGKDPSPKKEGTGGKRGGSPNGDS